MYDNFKHLITLTWRSLSSNKVRSFLTMLGIIIGVGAVILIMSIGAGAQSLILSQLESFGDDLIAILPGQSDDHGPPSQAFGVTLTTLRDSDVQALQEPKNVTNVQAVVGYYQTSVVASWQGQDYDTTLQGVTNDYLEVEGVLVEQGRFFSDEEAGSMARVAVLGSLVAKELFGLNDPLGQRIKIKNQSLEVIGVLEKRGQVGLRNYDDQIIAPLLLIQKNIAGVNHLSSVKLKLQPEADIDQAMEETRQTLREQHRIISSIDDDFSVRSLRDAIDMITTITNALKYFLAAMATLSLLVGGIGIMNILLVSVTERTREIGLRKAIGATKEQILRQFLLESIALTLTGGMIGIISGISIAYLIAVVAQVLGYRWSMVISWPALGLAVTISITIGLVFGLYPARRASQLDPIEALQYE